MAAKLQKASRGNYTRKGPKYQRKATGITRKQGWVCASRLKTRCGNLNGKIIITEGTDVTIIMYRLLLSCGPPTDKISLISHAVAALKCSLPTPTQWMDFKQIIPAESLHMINNYLSSPKQPPLAHFCLSPTSSLNKMFILTGELQPTSVFLLNSYPCHKFNNLRHSFCFFFPPASPFFPPPPVLIDVYRLVLSPSSITKLM